MHFTSGIFRWYLVTNFIDMTIDGITESYYLMKKSSLSIFVLLDNIITDTFINKIKHQTKIFTNIIPLVFSLVKMEYHQ
jgi:hypothetical protein